MLRCPDGSTEHGGIIDCNAEGFIRSSGSILGGLECSIQTSSYHGRAAGFIGTGGGTGERAGVGARGYARCR
jgi:hypothetical protein